ncbi:MAG: hypothetical protein U5L03_02750 [Burkholderiaceae bacterium]|nr:hypothetical protein [Burkholderiaceae bacterium]
MCWLGKYRLVGDRRGRARPASVSCSCMFEVWFLVPLPKGPLEAACS